MGMRTKVNGIDIEVLEESEWGEGHFVVKVGDMFYYSETGRSKDATVVTFMRSPTSALKIMLPEVASEIADRFGGRAMWVSTRVEDATERLKKIKDLKGEEEYEQR